MKTKYKVDCVVEFISQFERSRHGYLDDLEEHPVLAYKQAEGDLLYWKHSGMSATNEFNYMVIYEYMIKEKYTIEEAQDKFPELFL